MAQMEAQPIARVYAEALLELAQVKGEATTIEHELTALVGLVHGDGDLHTFFTSRTVDDDDRRTSLEKMFRGRLSDLLLNTLQVMNNKDRTELIYEFEEQYRSVLHESENVIEVHVTTVEPLVGDLNLQLVRLMEEKTGKKVLLIEHRDPSVLGGMIVRVGDQKIDLSAACQLRRMFTAILDHASRHIHAGSTMVEGELAGSI